MIFSWWKKRQEAKRAPRLFGVRLDQNHYLGYTTISFSIDEEGKKIITSRCNIHFFVDKEDFTDRTFRYDSIEYSYESDFYNHVWMIQARLWKIEETPLYYPVRDQPSKWLKKYMLEKFDHIWSTEKSWWVKNTESKILSEQDNV